MTKLSDASRDPVRRSAHREASQASASVAKRRLERIARCRGASFAAHHVSDLNRPENRFERRFGKLLEVYLPIRGTNGKTILYEDYERYSSVAASGRRLTRGPCGTLPGRA